MNSAQTNDIHKIDINKWEKGEYHTKQQLMDCVNRLSKENAKLKAELVKEREKTNNIEIWKDFHGYKVSNMGNILNKKGRMLKMSDNKGYRIASIEINGSYKNIGAHRIVASLFVCGESDQANQVNHRNTLRHDNRAVNLEWVSPRENMLHSVMESSNRITGEIHPMSKLSDLQRIEILEMLYIGTFTLKEIAAKYGVDKTLIGHVKHKRVWKKVINDFESSKRTARQRQKERDQSILK